ncbi:MAG: hypothetical protein JW915_08585 [Chitinispirillaceae bacterium]|nr:hypothetical protein [Chitinispirillaceae bacterium]
MIIERKKSIHPTFTSIKDMQKMIIFNQFKSNASNGGIFKIVSVFIACMTLALSAVGGEINWKCMSAGQDINNMPHLNSICYSGKDYVMTGASGRILHLSGQFVLEEKTSPVSYHLYSVTFGNNKFVAVGDHGSIVFSSDGKSWSKSTFNGNVDLRSVTFVNGKFFAIGTSTELLSSVDGNSWEWTPVNDAILGGITQMNYITFIDNQYFIVTEKGVILTSIDAVTWKYVYVLPDMNSLNCLIKGDNTYIAVGNNGTVVISPDGTNWAPRNFLDYSITENNLYSIIYTADRFIAAGRSNECYISKSKGIEWTTDKIECFLNDRITSIISINDTLLATGYAGTIYLGILPNNAFNIDRVCQNISTQMHISYTGNNLTFTLPGFEMIHFTHAALFSVSGRQLRFF